ncbi:Ferritin-1 [Cardamine amara subsp. amara]|uniref:Ferritin n=1 Tax=Cardamine amara subsp. amara TaxID=228776 RepID=A0ABD1AK14_CARAN
MASRALSSFTTKPTLSPKPLLPHGAASPPVSLGFSTKNGGRAVLLAAATVDTNNMPMTGVVFQPFEEVKKADLAIPITSNVSLARQRYTDAAEAAINEQINVEYNVSYVYHSMYAYFDRDNIAMKGLAKFFKESSDEEREHAEKFMEYQNKRGGRVKLHPIVSPVSEFEHGEKGDALYAMELALSLEKLTNEKLLNLLSVASENNDPQLADFVESEFLGEQIEAIKKISDYITQLRMVGKGHGAWHFDQSLLN